MTKNIKRILIDKSNDYSDLEKDFYKKTGKSLIFDNCTIEEVSTKNVLSASVVIPAWNASDTILSCLSAIEKSSFNQKYSDKLEAVITDDGSTDNTYKILKNSNFNLNLTVVQQANHGQGQAMNAAISAAKNDIIIEVDADTILNYYAIENLMARHQFYKDALYTGFRYYVDKKFKKVSLDYIEKKGPDRKFYLTSDERITFPEPGWPDNMNVTSNHYKNLGNLKGLWMGNDDNDDPWILADMVFGMLFSIPRQIFKKIGGFDDRFEGWGCDDGYVGAKAVSEGVFVIPVYTSTAFHISHPFRTKDKQSEYDFNRKFFFEFINSLNYKGHPDWITKASKRITNRFTIKNKVHNATSKTKKNLTLNVQYLLDSGRYGEAYKKIIIQKNKNIKYYNDLCKVLDGMDRQEEIIVLLEKLTKNKQFYKEDLLFHLAISYSSIGKFDKAKYLLVQISKINPEYPSLRYWLYRDQQANLRQGIKYYKEGFYKIAKRCFEAVLVLKPKNKEARTYRDKCMEQLTVRSS